MWMLLSSTALADPAWCDARKALYAWNCTADRDRQGESGWWHLLHDTNGCGGRLVDFATAHRFDRVYLYVGAVQWDWETSFSHGRLPDEDALAALTTRLRAAGIEPWALWYLNDDPDDLGRIGRVADLVASVAAFGDAHPDGAFAGLHGDQEPNDRASYGPYLEMNAIGLGAVPPGLGWGASHKPAWLDTPYDGAPMFRAVLDRATHGTLMDYSDDPARVRARAETFLAYADTTGVRAEIAVETGTTDPTPGVSFAELVATDPEAFFALMGALDEDFRTHPSYDGLVVHDFTQFFAGLNAGIEPLDFVGEVPVVCAPPVAPPDTADDTGDPVSGPEPETQPDAGCGCGHGTGAGGWLGPGLIAGVFRRLKRRTIASGR